MKYNVEVGQIRTNRQPKIPSCQMSNLKHKTLYILNNPYSVSDVHLSMGFYIFQKFLLSDLTFDNGHLQGEQMSQTRLISLMENAINLLGELPDTYKVFITSAHPQRIYQLSSEFCHAGLVDIRFVTIVQIKHGVLRGHRGILLIDDFYELPLKDQAYVTTEQKILETHE